MSPIFPSRFAALDLSADPTDSATLSTPAPVASSALAAPISPLRAVPPDLPAVVPVLELSGFHGYMEPFVSPEDSRNGRVGGAERLATVIDRETHRSPDALLLSGGDFFQGPAISTAFDGKPVVEFMNYEGFDAMTLGNHDFDHGVNALADRLKDARFAVLGANLCDGRTGQPVWETDNPLHMVRPYQIFTAGDRRVAVVGLMKPETAVLTGWTNTKGCSWKSIPDTLRALLPQLVSKEHPDVVILHCQQIHESRAILRQAREIVAEAAGDQAPLLVFMGGHGHKDFTAPVTTPDGLIVQSSDRGAALNVTRLSMAAHAPRLLGVEHAYVPVEEGAVQPDPGVTAILRKYRAQLDRGLNHVAGESRTDLTRSKRQDGALGNLVTEALREAGGAQVAFVTGGSLKSDVMAGPVTLSQLQEAMPFENALTVIRMRGDQLLAVLQKSASRPTGDKVLQMAGARMVYDGTRPPGQRLLSAEVNGQKIDPNASYRVAIDNFLASGGDFFDEFTTCPHLSEGGRVRDIVADYLRRHSPVAAAADGRIQEI